MCAIAQFVLKLMKERPSSIIDSINGAEHNVSPVQLGHRIMISREAIAAGMKKFDFETYVVRTGSLAAQHTVLPLLSIASSLVWPFGQPEQFTRFPPKTSLLQARTNVEVLRQHLESSSYTSGGTSAERGRRRR